MKINELKLLPLTEMANEVISGYAESKIEIWASRKSQGGKHWKRLKVRESNREGFVPWDSKKQPEGNLSDKTIKTVTNFIVTYQELLDSLWDEYINDAQFKEIYKKSKTEGLDFITKEIQKIKDTK